MDVKTRNRAELKSYFVKNSIPTQRNFEELIDGMLNQKEDGLAKQAGAPLSLAAVGETQKAINFYANVDAPQQDWTLSLNPRSNGADANSAQRLGFTISDGEENNRLFISRSTGNVGIGTVAPEARLHVAGPLKIDGANTLELGAGVNGKETNAGKIGYQTFTNDALDIIGAGASSVNRKIKLWAEGGATIAGNLTVMGELRVTGDWKTNALERMTPLYLRGTGLNNKSPRVLVIGSTRIYDATVGSQRGLTLTILNKTNHALISTTNYDTYGNVQHIANLSTALNGMTKEQIGILTSYDAWEGSLSEALRTAFRRVGLYKAAVTIGGNVRRPYAAIFEASSSTTIGTAKAVEVMLSDNSNAPFAEVRGWLIDGSFLATASAPNALTNNLGSEPIVVVNESSNVGIGTTSPETKLDVVGTVKATELRTTLYTATATTAAAISSNNTWADFPDLSRTFTLTSQTNVLVFYQIAMARGGTGNSHLVTRLLIDGGEHISGRAINGDIAYWSPSSIWMGALSAGSHTIKVQYRTPAGGTNDPVGSDWNKRVLQILVFGS
ncbi:MAG: interleukin-like EMT inducer domain-containing protein [Caldilineaceae bacterium]